MSQYSSSTVRNRQGDLLQSHKDDSSSERLLPHTSHHHNYGSTDRSSAQESSNINTSIHSQASHNEHESKDIWANLKGCANTLLWFLLDQYFLVGLTAIVVFTSQIQVPKEHQKIKQTIVIYLAVSIIFFITGCTIPSRTLLDNYSRWKTHLFVQSQGFLMCSAITFAIVSACATNPEFMDPWLLIGMIFLGSLPTVVASNVIMTQKAKGNTALTVVESTIGNVISPFITPLLIQLYTSSEAWYTDVLPSGGGGRYAEIYKRVFKLLGLSIFLPLILGQVVQNVFPNATHVVFRKWKLSKLSSIAMLSITWQTFDQAFESGAFTSIKTNNIVFMVLIDIAMFLLWAGIAFFTSMTWLSKQDAIATSYCVPAKALAQGVPLSTVMYVGLATIQVSKIQIPIIVFQGVQIASGSLLTLLFRKWLARDEKKRKAATSGDFQEADEEGSYTVEQSRENRERDHERGGV